ncbi:MAG: hypothetical protein WKF43_02745 [Acidimicrobiales bacterium]
MIRPRRSRARWARLGAATLALGLLATGCGSDDDPGAGAGADPTTTVSTASSSEASADAVATADSSLGQILVDGKGSTLYGFMKDTDGTPTCNDACADAWPPVLVADEKLPAGLDTAVFSVVARSDGTFQLSAGDWPLYRFAGDASPGDVNGQGRRCLVRCPAGQHPQHGRCGTCHGPRRDRHDRGERLLKASSG